MTKLWPVRERVAGERDLNAPRLVSGITVLSPKSTSVHTRFLGRVPTP